MHLSHHHEKMLLDESVIAPEIAEERGYRTVERKVELKELGFSDAQRNVPGLLIPIWAPAGEIVLYQYRPDEPRIKAGKPVKYETMPRSRMTLDVHPSNRDRLHDPAIPLFVTEGVKKGDSIASQGLCALSLLGVWNWRGTNARSGKVALPEWELVALNDREVYIVFDSDVALKPEVHAAMLRLKNFLEGR